MTIIESLRDALSTPNPHESQARVHDIVARRIDELTPASRVRSTGYFNHSWAPDLLVVTGDEPERGVFLRFGVRDASFADDLEHLSNDGPIFLDLSAANPSGPAPAVNDEEAAGFDLVAALGDREDGAVLVTDAPAIERFDAHIERERDVRTATQQVVVGGRGLIDEVAADRIGMGWVSANQAATEANPASLRAALDQVEGFLSRIASLDLETTLRARWIAAGQPAETFPGREDWRLGDRAPWELARLVLSLVDREEGVEPERWIEIAEAISASELGHELYRIGQYREGGAVNDLVRAGLRLWTAQVRVCPSARIRFDGTI
jgi:hypothetical protein